MSLVFKFQIRRCGQYWRRPDRQKPPTSKATSIPRKLQLQTWYTEESTHQEPTRSRVNNTRRPQRQDNVKAPELTVLYDQNTASKVKDDDQALATAIRRKYQTQHWRPRLCRTQTKQLTAEMINDVNQYIATGHVIGVKSTSALVSIISKFGAPHLLKTILSIIKLPESKYTPLIHRHILFCYKNSKESTLTDLQTTFKKIPPTKQSEGSYSIMIHEHLKLNDRKSADASYQEMLKLGIKPSNVTFSILLGLADSWEDLTKRFSVMKNPTPREFQRFVTVASSISSESGEKAMQMMVNSGYQCNRFLYNTLILAYRKEDNWPRMVRTYDAAISSSNCDHVTFNIMIKWCRERAKTASDEYAIFAQRVMFDADERGFTDDNLTALYVVLLAKIGRIEAATPLYFKVFNRANEAKRRILHTDLNLIAGYAEFPPPMTEKQRDLAPKRGAQI
eukprot:TRINITY_DN3237_c1_g2_i1.p1 TRINITY_DN3237_c1_g2~~TRINITY_DN3237_c1_g2_i1.p1  ORF type:complete len:449 (+),score=42.34 TRINITY_DN3237_c1_g2_i1:160-1506(+)